MSGTDKKLTFWLRIKESIILWWHFHKIKTFRNYRDCHRLVLEGINSLCLMSYFHYS